MTKEKRNNPLRAGKTFGLPKSGILRRRDRFKRLFEQPVERFYEKHLSLRFYLSADGEYACKMGFAVSKKRGKAVERNYVKRIMKEAYRLNRRPLMEALEASSTRFYGVLIGKTVETNFKTVENEMIRLLSRVIKDLHSAKDLCH